MSTKKVFIRRHISKTEIKRRIELALKMLQKMQDTPSSVTELDVGRALLGGKETYKPWLDNTETSCVADFYKIDDLMHFDKAFYIGNEDEINEYYANHSESHKLSKDEAEFYSKSETVLSMINENWHNSLYGHPNSFSIKEISSEL